MPRNFHRKDRHQHELLNTDSATQPLPGWNQNQASKQQNWWTADADKTYPKVGENIVSRPNATPFSQKQRCGPTRSFPSYQRNCMLVSDGAGSYQKKRRTVELLRPDSRAIMFNSSEIKEFLLQAVEEGKRRMGEWIVSRFEQMSITEKDIIMWESCAMDWQPEKTVVIPQAVSIRYPWDSAEDTAKERWRRKRSGRDEMMEEVL